MKTIYIIDDDPSVRKVLVRLLRTHGYLPEAFGSVREFDADAEPERAICLILDINLNGESGIDFKRRLSCSVPGLPVIFITGSDIEAVRSAVQQVGGAALLSKPFAAKSLLSSIEAAARTRS